jgi:hypothetical protein
MTTAKPDLDSLRDAEAAFRLDATPANAADVVDAAVDLLVHGVDTPNLRILAGHDRADASELKEDLDATLGDLGFEPFDAAAAALHQIDDLARRLLEDSVDPQEGCQRVWATYVRGDYPRGHELAQLVSVADHFNHGFATWGPPFADVQTAARAYLAARASGDIRAR